MQYLCTKIINVYKKYGIKMWYRGSPQCGKVHTI